MCCHQIIYIIYRYKYEYVNCVDFFPNWFSDNVMLSYTKGKFHYRNYSHCAFSSWSPTSTTISYLYDNYPTTTNINYSFQNTNFKYCKPCRPLAPTTFLSDAHKSAPESGGFFFRFISCVFSWTIADRSVSIPLRADPRMNQAQQHSPVELDETGRPPAGIVKGPLTQTPL